MNIFLLNIFFHLFRLKAKQNKKKYDKHPTNSPKHFTFSYSTYAEKYAREQEEKSYNSYFFPQQNYYRVVGQNFLLYTYIRKSKNCFTFNGGWNEQAKNTIKKQQQRKKKKTIFIKCIFYIKQTNVYKNPLVKLVL